jgi:hypothetical protein
MTHYCETSDVSQRLGLDASQRTRAETRLESAVRRASIDIDQTFRDFGRSTPSDALVENTLNGAISAGATSITLTDASSFSTSGSGNIDGDSFSWSGKSSNDLTGCTGITFDHQNNSKVQEGEFAHVLREICADIAASYYMEDESMYQGGDGKTSRGIALKKRGMSNLQRLAHLGDVI